MPSAPKATPWPSSRPASAAGGSAGRRGDGPSGRRRERRAGRHALARAVDQHGVRRRLQREPTAASRSAPRASSAASAPLNVSPAPVVSTTACAVRPAASRCGCASGSPASRTPSSPSVTTTGAPVRAASARAAAAGSASPERTRASPAFGVTWSAADPRRHAGTGGAGLSDGRPHWPRARLRTCAAMPPAETRADQQTSKPHPPPVERRRRRRRPEPPLAPAPTAIWFSPRLVDDDQGGPGGDAGAARRRRVDALGLELGDGVGAELIRRRPRHQQHVAPGGRAATAALAPLPPPWRARSPASTVSPRAGSEEATTTWSTLTDPTTTTPAASTMDADRQRPALRIAPSLPIPGSK